MANLKNMIIASIILFAGLMLDGCGSGPLAVEMEFMQAIYENNVEKVRYMLAETPKLANAKDEQSIALHSAAHSGGKDICELLIANGADINAKSKTYRRWTALHFAVYDNNKDIVEFLVAKGADVNSKAKGGITPICCKSGWRIGKFDWDIVRFLIDHGARVNWKSGCGRILLNQ